MKKIITIASLALTLNAFAQCNASFTYTTTNSSISVTSTSTGTTSNTHCAWDLSGDYGYNASATFGTLYNGTYTVSLTLSGSISCASITSRIITISGGANPHHVTQALLIL